MSRAATLRGSFYAGQAVEFDAKGGSLRGVLVEFAGSRWVTRTEGGKTWRVPAHMLRNTDLTLDTEATLALVGAEPHLWPVLLPRGSPRPIPAPGPRRGAPTAPRARGRGSN